MSKCLFCKSDEGPLLLISGDVCVHCAGALHDNAALRSRVEALEGVVRELVQACGCEEENKRIIEVMHIPKNGGPPTFSDPEEHCPVCTKALALLAPPANEGTPERKGGE